MATTLFPVAKNSAELYLPVLPAERKQISALREAANSCKGCDLYKYATQTVFGEGARRAKMLLVGEQPGDKEDLAGKRSLGPPGNYSTLRWSRRRLSVKTCI